MATPLKVLIIEDSEDDVAALLHELRRGGYEPDFERVETPEAMKSALTEKSWDLIIADYSMPRFSALAALTMVQESELDLPFIILSGVIGEDAAVAAMKAGAHDYVFKGNMTRLVPAIEREIQEAAGRARHRELENTTEQLVETYEERVRNEKLIAIGRWSGGVAHDLRNPLGAISNAAYTLNKWLAADGAAQSNTRVADSIKMIKQEVSRADAILSNLLDYSQLRRPSLTLVDLAQVINECLARVEENDRVQTDEVQITKVIEPDLPPILADSVHISRVFENLAINACEAMPDGGQLTVRAWASEVYAEVDICDTGVGIEDETIQNLFDPLFTTKIQGTGLGLAICADIVARHGGTLDVSSTIGLGTTFTVKLPLEGQVAYKLALKQPNNGSG